MFVLLLALLVQDRPVLPAPDDDAMRVVPPRQKCELRADEITVCAIDTTRFRLTPADDARWAEKPIRPDFKLPGGASATVHAEQRSLPGASAPAAFVTLKMPLGGKKKVKK